MAYRIYQTEGIVLRSVPVGEADRFFSLWTRDHGLVGARAQGVRGERSKLRASLSDFSHTYPDLVRGERVWRVVGARYSGIFAGALTDTAKARTLARAAFILRRLCPPEEPNEILFDECVRAGSFLASPAASADILSRFELSFAATVLTGWGYWGDSPEEQAIVPRGVWSREFLLSLSDHLRRAATVRISRALAVTGL